MTKLSGQLSGLGAFDGKTHILPIRVYYEDTDLSGVIYHANYLRYMERGRTEFFRLAGISKMAGLDAPEPTAWAIRKVEVQFHRPGRLDDVLQVQTMLTGITGARMTATQRIYANDVMLTDGRIEACVITLTGKPRRIPPEVHAVLSPFLVETDT
jgi:acyl-CoA thioester hydrolase